jgi:hypothetical protein
MIDLTYFTLDKNLPTDTLSEKITGFIAKYEPEILIKALGYDLYKAYIAGLAAESPLAKWTNLRDGCEYLVDGIYYRWRGMLNALKDSFLAYYVYYKMLREDVFVSSLGLKAISTENSTVADKGYKQADVYNIMVDEINEMWIFIILKNSEDNTTYPNFYPETINKVNSLGI